MLTLRAWFRLASLLTVLSLTGCASGVVDDDSRSEGEPEGVSTTAEALSSISCTESQDTGYKSGSAFPITVVTVDGKKVEKDTANAYYLMAQAADQAGVTLKVVSGFRTMSEQQYLYSCYVNCSCNNCNLAAKPGYSNHQSGHALDLNTSSSGVLNWLNNHGASYGFKRTVPSEAWHWEWWGGGPGGGPCGVEYKGESLGLDGQSYPIVSKGAVTVEVGQTVTGWIKLKNVGAATWKPGKVLMAPIPRDQPSPFASPSWVNDHRISSVTSDVAPGAVGQFALDITGKVEGESILELGWVAEGVTWFASGPKGGGPPDGYFAVKVKVVPAPVTGSGGSAGTGSGGVGAAGSAGATSGAGGSWGSAGDGNSGAAGDGWGGESGSWPGAGGAAASSDEVVDSQDGCSIGGRSAPRPFLMAWLGLLGVLALWRRR